MTDEISQLDQTLDDYLMNGYELDEITEHNTGDKLHQMRRLLNQRIAFNMGNSEDLRKLRTTIIEAINNQRIKSKIETTLKVKPDWNIHG